MKSRGCPIRDAESSAAPCCWLLADEEADEEVRNRRVFRSRLFSASLHLTHYFDVSSSETRREAPLRLSPTKRGAIIRNGSAQGAQRE